MNLPMPAAAPRSVADEAALARLESPAAGAAFLQDVEEWQALWSRITHDLRAHARHMQELGAWIESDLAQASGAAPETVQESLTLLRHSGRTLDAFAKGLAGYMTAGVAAGNCDAPGHCSSVAAALDAVRDNLTECRTLAITVDLAADSLPISAADLIRLLSILLTNSARHAAIPYPEVQISTRADDGAVVLTVADNGCGLPEAHYEKACTFGTSLTTDTDTHAPGIGLATAARLCALYGGTFSLGPAGTGPGLAVTARFPAPAPPVSAP